jgi:hypothetical protein
MTGGKVSFLWRDYAHGHRTPTMTLDAHEFLRRFLLHVLPAGFVRIRYFGLLANRHRNPSLSLCREYLRESLSLQISQAGAKAGLAKLCQHCRRGIMRLVEVLSPAACYLVTHPTSTGEFLMTEISSAPPFHVALTISLEAKVCAGDRICR